MGEIVMGEIADGNRMPKIIDHEKYKRELAQKAAMMFSEYGYSGLGMRTIASNLGMSKSALYHYFPTKRELFHACTQVVTQANNQGATALEGASLEGASKEERVHALIEVMKQIEPTFPNEMSLLFDYLRGRTPIDISHDETMKLANENYIKLVAKFAGDDAAKPVLCLMLGTLLMRYFDGQTTKFEEIETSLLHEVLDSDI
ncbi:MAG: TetR family transcriptional regulator [Robiginitomaculum sp.]|nr:MAG: TetR family transcriptional regulator [Robiginitomaculum sp.]